METLWENILHQISAEIPKNTFSLWIHPIALLESTPDTWVLGFPNKFSRDWVIENYLPLLRETVHRTAGAPVRLQMKIQDAPPALSAGDEAPTPQQLAFPTIGHNGVGTRRELNRKFTFDRFIVGQSNEFAYSASKALAQGALREYDTLFMMASTGLGKTHLAHAVGHSVLKTDPRMRVCYATAEDFTNEMIASIRNNSIEAFKSKYRRCCDVLLLEEVQFLSGKEKTQQELGFTLDALINDKKRVIFTSAVPPNSIPRISRSLSSRLTSGLLTAISQPDHETRVKIITRKASELDLCLPDPIVDHLASRLIRDVRQMESALKCLKAKSHLLKAKVDMGLAQEVLASLAEAESSITPDHISKLVCTYYKVEPDMLVSKSRKKMYALPRNIYAYLCRRHTDRTLDVIGKTINRSHSAVLYASELVEHKMKTEKKLKQQVQFLDEKLEEMKSAG